MANWSSTKLTDAGRKLQAKVEAGAALVLTRMKLGNGTESLTDALALTDLSSARAILGISAIVPGDGLCEITAILQTSTVTAGFYAREWGLFATDPDDGEILYMVCIDDAPDFVPPADVALKASINYTMHVVVSSNINITATVDPNGIPTVKMLGDYLTKTDAANTYATLVESATHLKTEDAKKTYLPIATAANTYLRITAAANTYITKAAANAIAGTHLTKTDAAATYLTKRDANTTYLPRNTAASTYLTKTDASSTYLTKTDATNTYLAREALLNAVYPVGAVYISTVSTSPATLFGGSWRALPAGRVLIGAGSASSGTNYSAGATGGEERHTLSTSEMPAHNHSGSASTATLNGTFWAGRRENEKPTGIVSETRRYNLAMKSGSGDDWGSVYSINASHGHTVTVNSTGGNAAHNNMQPYLVVYMWQRTA